MPNQKNQETVKNLRDQISKAKSIVFTDYQGLTVNEVNELRDSVGEEGAQMQVAKNTLFRIALEQENKSSEALSETLTGQTAAFFSFEDAILPIKKLFEFNKKTGLPEIKSAIIEGKIVFENEIEALSKLPGKDELRAKVVGGLKSPLVGIVNVLGGPQRKFVYALSAIAEKKEV